MRTKDPDFILGPAFGEGAALTKVGADILVSPVDPIVGAIGNIGWLAVHVACNDIAVGGLSRPLVAVTALGTASGRKPVRSGGAGTGERLLVTKGVALERTAILAQDFADVGRKLGLTENEIKRGRRVLDQVIVVREALILASHSATAMHDVTRGGLLEALLEIALLSKVAIEVEFSRLPIPAIVSRFAEVFDFDPLRMISSGTLAATISSDRMEEVSHALARATIPFAFIGQLVEGNGVHVMRDGNDPHYSEIRGEEDEPARMWAVYPRGQNEDMRMEGT